MLLAGGGRAVVPARAVHATVGYHLIVSSATGCHRALSPPAVATASLPRSTTARLLYLRTGSIKRVPWRREKGRPVATLGEWYATGAVTARSSVSWVDLSDSTSATDRADARPRRCFGQDRLASGCDPAALMVGSAGEALRPSTTAQVVGRRRPPQPHSCVSSTVRARGAARAVSTRGRPGRCNSPPRATRRPRLDQLTTARAAIAASGCDLNAEVRPLERVSLSQVVRSSGTTGMKRSFSRTREPERRMHLTGHRVWLSACT
jgi:hypothetical protein